MNREIVLLRKWLSCLKWFHRRICQQLQGIHFRLLFLKRLGPFGKAIEQTQRPIWQREETIRWTAGRCQTCSKNFLNQDLVVGLVCRWHFLCQTCRRVSAIQNMAPVLAALLHVQKIQLVHLRFCVLDHLACADSLISILNAASQRRQFSSDILPYPNFHPLI